MKKYYFAFIPFCLILSSTAQMRSAQATEPRFAISPISSFAQHCYEPNRRGGRPLEPAPSSAWQPMSDYLRTVFEIPADPDLRVWIQPGSSADDVMLLQMHERQLEKAGVHSGQFRISCRVVVVSEGLSPERLNAGLVYILGSRAGSNRKSVLRNLGYPTPEGWNQDCWTVLTHVENTDWQTSQNAGRPTCVHLTTPQNYATSQYVVVRLLTNESSGVAVVEFDRTLRPEALAD